MERRSFIGSFLAGLAAFVTGKTAVASPLTYKGSLPISLAANQEEDPDAGVFFTDIFVMIDAIASHTRATGETITSADNPDSKYIGFKSSSDKQWFCSLADVGKSLSAADAEPDPRLFSTFGLIYGKPQPISRHTKAVILRHYLKDTEGREKMARSFPGQKSPNT